MSTTGKPSTPIGSPKLKTPSPPSNKKRHSGQFLHTPEPPKQTGLLPFTPSYKRTSSGSYKSPDGKIVYQNVNSPYSAAQLIKTPRHSEDERKSKVQKTPQYFPSAKKLFQNESPSKDLSEISTTLKQNLSSAFGKIQNHDHKITFTELEFDSKSSPTKKQKSSSLSSSSSQSSTWIPSTSLTRTNLNLQTLQQSPISKATRRSRNSFDGKFLQQSPVLNEMEEKKIASPDEESSAQNALLAALSRRKSRTSFNHGQRKPPDDKEIKLPPLNIAFNQEPKNEQDAVLSLMSLSSPQQVKFSHSRSHSLNGNASPNSSRSSSAPINSPKTNQIPPILPPLSKLIRKTSFKDEDETDFESNNDDTDDDKL